MKRRIILVSISFVLVILSLFLFAKLTTKVKVEDFDNTKSTIKEEKTTNKENPITIKDVEDKEEKNY